MVQRLAKGVLQPNTSISKDALLALSKGATVFINYLAQSANEANLATNRKNIPPSAVFEGLNDIEFTDFIPRVEAELKRYNDVQTGKRNDYRRKVKEGKMGFGGRGGAGSGSGGEGDGEEGNGRAAKRVRRASGDTTESPEARRENGLGDPNQQLQQQMAEDDEDEDFDPPDDEEPEEAARELRQKPEEEEEGDEEEEEEDEDDEDAFPDEGMRLSSIERENYALDHPDDPVTPGSSADEEGSEEEGSD
ncbi:DNA polymerase epsilon subunit 3, partial [Lecanoromycetidae sp. Uapishka_2]